MLRHNRYHWSVEYFEDLRNVNHCEFIIMKRSENNGKYILQNELRTWSELKRRAAKEKEKEKEGTTNSTTTTPSRATPLSAGGSGATSSPTIPVRRWGGCVNGCDHDKIHYPRRPMRKNTMDYQQAQQLAPPATVPLEALESEKEDHPVAAQEPSAAPIINEPTQGKLSRKQSTKGTGSPMPPSPASPNDASNDASSSEEDEAAKSIPRSHQHPQPRTAAILRHLQQPNQTLGEGFSDDSDYFPGMQHLHSTSGHRKLLKASSKQRQQSKERKLARRQTEQSWKEESGMGSGTKTDRLGDGGATHDEAAAAQQTHKEEPILREALKGDMVVEIGEESREQSDEYLEAEKAIGEAEVDKLKDADRKGFGEVY
jgi:hypothetical protein